MKAVKGNKVYTIDESQKNSYLKQGFDITEDNGTIIDYGAGKTIDYKKYKELEDKYAALESENINLKISAMTVDQLKAYALEKNIDLGEATTKDAILAKIIGE